MKPLFSFLFILLLAAPWGTTQEKKPEGRAGTLQHEAKQKLVRLMETLSRLSNQLKEREKEKATLLRAALKYCGEKGLEDRMVQAEKLVRTGRIQEALDLMRGIEQDLGTLLDLLLNRNRELLELLKRIELLEELKRRADALIEEQEKERDLAARTAALKELARQLAAAARELERLERAQRELASQARAGGGDPAHQRKLKEETEKAGREIGELARKNRDLGGKAGEGAERAAGRVQGAAGDMGKAREKLASGAPRQAVPPMEQAAEKLARAREDLAEQEKRIRDRIHRLDLEQQARKQEKTAEKTGKLGQEMEEGKGEPVPGAEGMKGAVPHQQKAAGKLGKGRPGGAVPEQDEALDRMKQGKEELEDALAQARRRLQEELLRALEERIATILAHQKRISGATRVLHQQAAGAYPPPRAVRLKAGKLGKQEGDLAGEARLALRLLTEEGSTVVIPEIMRTVIDDLLLLAERLGEHRTGPVTQDLQREVEELLSTVLEAIKEAREKQNQDEGKDGDQQDQDQPLVPRSAELRMIRILQNMVYRATLRAKLQMEENQEKGAAAARRLAGRQKRIYELTRKLANQIDKDLAEGEEGSR